MNSREITIGKVVGTHGNRGVLKVFPITDFPGRFLEMESITLELGGRQSTYTVEEASGYRRFILIRLAEVADMNAAEALKGAFIKINRDELTPLPEGSYYIFDIVGLQVYTPAGKLVGEVEDVLQTGANDVYVVKTAGGGPVLVPALKEIIREMDVRGGRMVVDYPEFKGDE